MMFWKLKALIVFLDTVFMATYNKTRQDIVFHFLDIFITPYKLPYQFLLKESARVASRLR